MNLCQHPKSSTPSARRGLGEKVQLDHADGAMSTTIRRPSPRFTTLCSCMLE
ncbi:hypothetical protein PISMIDRAFT_681872 [Pisolithus microcarpus 441]|uniref:Uncharacterized protein n=1 Tax=Pisolithus microcarpus 441 TaxID=765257 RepID=A0A0C9ZEL2_9AGAM|nr:hypothetical protein PISMIDRAFT_681872 [Pisolithus microcarpus 441]